MRELNIHLGPRHDPSNQMFIQYKEWKAKDIEFYRQNGYGAPNYLHIQDGGVDVSHRSVDTTDARKETITLDGSLLWSREAFLEFFGSDPEASGHPWSERVVPGHGSLAGYKTPHKHVPRPLPKGVYPIKNTVEVAVTAKDKHLNSEGKLSADACDQQLGMLARRHFGPEAV